MVEKMCSQVIDANYPLMKFFSLVENAIKYTEKENEHYSRLGRK